MEVINSIIEGVKLICPDIHTDDRGYFYESFNQAKFESEVNGFNSIRFVQDNESKSAKNTIRGFHWQKGSNAQAKLVRCTHGAIIDYVIDLRKDSSTFGQHIHALLSADNHLQLFIPRGCTHGFITLKDDTVFQYKCDNYYNKESECGLHYSYVDWPIDISEAIISDKDKQHPSFEELDPTNLF